MSALFTQCPIDTVQTGTGKVEPVKKFKCTTAAPVLYLVFFIKCPLSSILYLYFILYPVFFILFHMFCILYTLSYILYSLYCIICPEFFILYDISCILYAANIIEKKTLFVNLKTPQYITLYIVT